MRELVEGLESLEREMLDRSRADGGGQPRSGWGIAGRSQTRSNVPFDPADIDRYRRDFAERRGMLERITDVLTADEHGARETSVGCWARCVPSRKARDSTTPQRAIARQRQLIAELKELELRLKANARRLGITSAAPDRW